MKELLTNFRLVFRLVGGVLGSVCAGDVELLPGGEILDRVH